LVGAAILLVCLQVWAQEAELTDQVAPDASPVTSSSIPRLIRFSGVLKDPTGKPLSGPVDVSFLLYKEVSGGAALWLTGLGTQ
jgi:hypothetical protein